MRALQRQRKGAESIEGEKKGKIITVQVSKKAAELLVVKRGLTISKIPLNFLKNILS